MAVVPSIEKRDYVINELIETEKNYVDVLNTLQKSFMRPLVNILPKDDFDIIFKGIKVSAAVFEIKKQSYFGFLGVE